MDAILWDEPVQIELRKIGHYRVVTNTREAVECLMVRWPKNGGPAQAAARRICFDVLDGNLPPEAARQAFVDAAVEAGIYVCSK